MTEQHNTANALEAACTPPTDSLLTPSFNETKIFDGAPYTNYEKWGILAGLLAAQVWSLQALVG
jgi:hypothetical protein